MPSDLALNKAKAAAKRRFARRKDVLGVGIGWDPAGESCVKVLLAEAQRPDDPESIGGVRVLYEVVGRIAKRTGDD